MITQKNERKALKRLNVPVGCIVRNILPLNEKISTSCTRFFCWKTLRFSNNTKHQIQQEGKKATATTTNTIETDRQAHAHTHTFEQWLSAAAAALWHHGKWLFWYKYIMISSGCVTQWWCKWFVYSSTNILAPYGWWVLREYTYNTLATTESNFHSRKRHAFGYVDPFHALSIECCLVPKNHVWIVNDEWKEYTFARLIIMYAGYMESVANFPPIVYGKFYIGYMLGARHTNERQTYTDWMNDDFIQCL